MPVPLIPHGAGGDTVTVEHGLLDDRGALPGVAVAGDGERDLLTIGRHRDVDGERQVPEAADDARVRLFRASRTDTPG